MKKYYYKFEEAVNIIKNPESAKSPFKEKKYKS